MQFTFLILMLSIAHMKMSIRYCKTLAIANILLPVLPTTALRSGCVFLNC